MKKDLLIVGIFIFIFIICASIVGYRFSDKKLVNPFTNPTISPQPTNTIQTATETPTPPKNIEVLVPLNGDLIKSGFVTKGSARVFENNVSIRLVDSKGNILVNTFTIADAPDAGQFGQFQKTLIFKTIDDSGTLEVYQASAKDGSEIDKVTIPVQFSK